MNLYELLALAEQNVDHNTALKSSAKSCLRDARLLLDVDNKVAARERALKSLAYSVGTLSATYRKALG